MRIVIDIPDEHYKQICKNKEDAIIAHDTCRRIAHGTPLPKGHGRLIDADKLEIDLEWLVKIEDEIKTFDVLDMVTSFPTTIEADKAKSEE